MEWLQELLRAVFRGTRARPAVAAGAGLALSILALSIVVAVYGSRSIKASDRLAAQVRDLELATREAPARVVSEAINSASSKVRRAVPIAGEAPAGSSLAPVDSVEYGYWEGYRDSLANDGDLVTLEIVGWPEPVTVTRGMVEGMLQSWLSREAPLLDDRFEIVDVQSPVGPRSVLLDKVLGNSWSFDGTEFQAIQTEDLVAIQRPESPFRSVITQVVDQVPGGWVLRRDTIPVDTVRLTRTPPPLPDTIGR